MNSATLTTAAALKKLGRDVSCPFSVALPDGSTLHSTDILRLLPNKRLVVRATHQGNTVLAKIFFDADNWHKEKSRYHIVQKTGATTPSLLQCYALENGGVCLYAFIDNAMPVDVLWQHSSPEQKQQYWQGILQHLQTLWQHQLLQRDLHLGNFLLQNSTQENNPAGKSTLWLLDPASCEAFRHPQEQENNLALLLAQLPFEDWPLLLPLLQEVLQAALPQTNAVQLATLAQQHWATRLEKYLQKIQRDCSAVADISNKPLRVLVSRVHLSEALADALHHPDALITDATLLKNGNSAKVFIKVIDGQSYVVKQYINKDWLRKLRRAFRLSRAARSWIFSHAFSFAGIAVPAPIALVEKRCGPIVTQAWFVSAYCPQPDLHTRWQTQTPTEAELSQLRALFFRLKQLRCSHGDMKASNILSDGQQLFLIDYDGTSEQHDARALQAALRKDKQRLLANWVEQPALQQVVAEHIDA
jgi:tRNA A-37 threonylcarbamoyl transferase component Bud32